MNGSKRASVGSEEREGCKTHLELLTRNRLREFVHDLPTPFLGIQSERDEGQSIHGFIVELDIDLAELRTPMTSLCVFEARVSRGQRLQSIMEIHDDFDQRDDVFHPNSFAADGTERRQTQQKKKKTEKEKKRRMIG